MTPYITPRKLLGDKRLPIPCALAFVCYCPMPSVFDEFDLHIPLKERYFIHVHNMHIMIGQYHETPFIVISEVYGGPVSVTTVEELHYYGVETIIGIGFVGALKPSLPVGTIVVAEKALTEVGTTPHYQKNRDIFVKPTMKMNLNITMEPTCVWTTNALYQEYPEDVKRAIGLGCSVVNMDTSHLYAACDLLDLNCQYYAVVTDIIGDHDWVNSLHDVVNTPTDSKSESPVLSQQTKLVLELLSVIQYC